LNKVSKKVKCTIPGNIEIALSNYEMLLNIIYGIGTLEISNELANVVKLLEENNATEKTKQEIHLSKLFLRNLGDAFKELTAEPLVILIKE